MFRFLAAVVIVSTMAGVAVMLSSVLVAEPGKADPVVVKGNNEFAFDLYGQLREQEGNLFFSPYSISTALGMTYAGARGQTAEEMAKTLHFTYGQDKLHPALGTLVAQVNGAKNGGYQLSTANALWGQKGVHFEPDFLQITKTHYGAGLKEVDFGGATEESRKTINAWVEKETRDKIKDLLKEGVLTPDTRLVLTNAIYFKGNWASQFKKNLTREEAFHVAADKKVQTPLMTQQGKFNFFESATFQMVELPYVGKDLSMVVLLPKAVDGLPALEKALTAAKLAEWVKNLHETEELTVTLPKFKTTSEFQLHDTLARMGMSKAFSPRDADFSGIDGDKDLFLSGVIHKAFVDVNEEGTEAAAATAVVLEPNAIKVKPVFRADHPFVFLIRDKRNDAVLFLGRLSNPQ